MKPYFLPVLFLFSVLFGTKTTCQAQQESQLTQETKVKVVDALIQAIDDLYLYQNRVPELSDKLKAQVESGAFDDSKTHYQFAMALTDALRSMTNDLHFAIRHGSQGSQRFGGFRLTAGGSEETENPESTSGEQRAVRIGVPGNQIQPGSPMYQALHEQFRKNNFSMPRLEVLPGNVGYLRLDMMPPLDVARPTLDAAMAFLANTDAMIIDVRDTPGGVGGFIPYLMSYFFADENKLLFTRYFGADDRTDRFHTAKELGGARRPDVPLFVLTSSSTGSAAENLAFTLKFHDRAKTVGETTRGGGHSARMAPLLDGFMATIPTANVIHPETGKGFDGVGVEPTIAIAAANALDKAHELAIEAVLESTTNDRERQFLTSALEEIRAARELEQHDNSTKSQFQEYVGSYGIRRIFLQDGKLRYQRQGGPALQLKPVSKDAFRLATPPSMRTAMELPNVRFERNDDGSVKGLSLVRGEEIESYEDKK